MFHSAAAAWTAPTVLLIAMFCCVQVKCSENKGKVKPKSIFDGFSVFGKKRELTPEELREQKEEAEKKKYGYYYAADFIYRGPVPDETVLRNISLGLVTNMKDKYKFVRAAAVCVSYLINNNMVDFMVAYKYPEKSKVQAALDAIQMAIEIGAEELIELKNKVELTESNRIEIDVVPWYDDPAATWMNTKNIKNFELLIGSGKNGYTLAEIRKRYVLTSKACAEIKDSDINGDWKQGAQKCNCEGK